MDIQKAPDELHPVQWESTGNGESGFISLDEATRRLSGYLGIPSDVIETDLRMGHKMRTPFAFYQWHTAEEETADVR